MAFSCKAQQLDSNGLSFLERCDAAAVRYMSALRISFSTPTDCVATPGNGMTIFCEALHGCNVDKLTEAAIITMIEYDKEPRA
jgi:hypothetical protein